VRPAGEDLFPTGLVFVAVGKHDVSVWEGCRVVFGELFEAKDVG
jgi:hypothetical protein